MKSNEQIIRERAYHLWEAAGKPHGQQEQHWHMANRFTEVAMTGQDQQTDNVYGQQPDDLGVASASTEPLEPLSPNDPPTPQEPMEPIAPQEVPQPISPTQPTQPLEPTASALSKKSHAGAPLMTGSATLQSHIKPPTTGKKK